MCTMKVGEDLCSPIVVTPQEPQVPEDPQSITWNGHLRTRLHSSLQQVKRSLEGEGPAVKFFSPTMTRVTPAYFSLPQEPA